MIKQQIEMMYGLPASGKSSYCKSKVLAEPNMWVRISRDNLREMFNEPHSGVAEKLAIRARDALIVAGLKDGKGILIDDTNLSLDHHKAHIEDLLKKNNLDVEIKVIDFTHVPLEECLKRNKVRANPVPEDVIRRMWRENLLPALPKPEHVPGAPKAIICDIDGTLALFNGRGPYDKEKYHLDLPNMPVVDILGTYDHWREFGVENDEGKQPNLKILIVSGREDDKYDVTYAWLRKHGIPFDALFMRKAGDFRNDAIIKREIYENEILGNYNVLFCLDDRDRVVNGWREAGLTCLQVAPGDF